MRMFDIGSESPLSDLDDETRHSLTRILEVRNEYMAEVTKLNEMKMAILRSPDPANEARISEYAALMVAPRRRELMVAQESLLKSAVDVDQLRSMLPMLLAAVIGSINLPLIMIALGIDPDQVTEILERTRTFIKDGIV